MSQLISIHDAFLSVLLSDGDNLDLDLIFQKCSPEMFPSWRKNLFTILKKSYEENSTLDLSLLAIPDEMIDGVASILSGYSTAANFQSYYAGVLQHHKRERVRKIFTGMEPMEFEEIETFIEKKIDSLEKILDEDIQEEYCARGDEASSTLLENLFQEEDSVDYSTGYPELDRSIYLSPGDLWIVGARPSMGKTAFLLSLAKNYAQRGIRVAIFSLEMSRNSLLQRLYANISGVSISLIMDRRRRTEVIPSQRLSVRKAGEKDYLKNIFFYDEPGCTIDTLKFHLKQFVRKHGIDIVCIDYLQYVGNDREFQRHDLKIAHTTREIKNILRTLEIPGIVLAQLNRKPDDRGDKRPLMGDLDGSSEIEKTADIISFLYREEYYNPETPNKNVLEITTGKQRNGVTGVVKLKFIREIGRII
ncbi:MAG: replicative DNA helicase [Fusobacteriaceae bacterium]